MKKKILSLAILMSIVSVSFGQTTGDDEVIKSPMGLENCTKDLVVKKQDIAVVKEEKVQLDKLDLNPKVFYEHMRIEESVKIQSVK